MDPFGIHFGTILDQFWINFVTILDHVFQQSIVHHHQISIINPNHQSSNSAPSIVFTSSKTNNFLIHHLSGPGGMREAIKSAAPAAGVLDTERTPERTPAQGAWLPPPRQALRIPPGHHPRCIFGPSSDHLRTIFGPSVRFLDSC